MTQVVNLKPDPWPYCPKCGAKMVLRSRRSDGERFWGCFDFPDCKGSRSIMPNGEPAMPESDGFDRYDLDGLSPWGDL